MGNLGWYQWFTTNAKKVGGPLKLMSLIAVGGYAAIRIGEAGVKKVIKLAKDSSTKDERNNTASSRIYSFNKKAMMDETKHVKSGEKFKILAVDRDAVMIEIINDENNPYFIHIHKLKDISDYV